MVFKFLNKFFRPQKSITFIFTGNNKNINLNIQYKKCNSEYIASMIYALNNGLFLGKMVQNLTDNIDIKNNNEILLKLDQLYLLDQKNDLLVKPLEAFEKNAK